MEGDLFPKATSTSEFVWLERLEKWKHGLILQEYTGFWNSTSSDVINVRMESKWPLTYAS